jgi:hypothetical protein
MLTSTPDIAARTPLPCRTLHSTVKNDDDLKKTGRWRGSLGELLGTDGHTDEIMVGLTSPRGGGIIQSMGWFTLLVSSQFEMVYMEFERLIAFQMYSVRSKNKIKSLNPELSFFFQNLLFHLLEDYQNPLFIVYLVVLNKFFF